jgi:hypothetical protein
MRFTMLPWCLLILTACSSRTDLEIDPDLDAGKDASSDRAISGSGGTGGSGRGGTGGFGAMGGPPTPPTLTAIAHPRVSADAQKDVKLPLLARSRGRRGEEFVTTMRISLVEAENYRSGSARFKSLYTDVASVRHAIARLCQSLRVWRSGWLDRTARAGVSST